MATQAEILDLLELLTSVCGQEPGDTRGYEWALSEYSIDILEDAAREHVKRNKWYPKPSELSELADRPQQERNKFWRMQHLFGDVFSGRIDDPRTEKAVDSYFGFDARRA